jgi:DNA polymerase III gamma/tau subunit
MAYKVLREIRKDLPRFCGRQIAITVNPRVAEVLLVRAHKACAELGRELGREIEIRGLPGLHQEQFEVTALDSGPPVSIPLQWLGFPPEAGDETASSAEVPTEADEASTTAAPEISEPAETAADESESASADATAEGLEPALTGVEARPAASEEETGESADTPDSALAESAPETDHPKSAPAAAPSDLASQESSPPEAAAPEDGSTPEPPITAGAGATESGERFSAPPPAVEMLDLEAETPILPPPAEVEKP